ncbi:monothiol glutaredoxin grx5 [Dispira parvispora]|uniref:Monothiol glutaredoxin-5, mitochondrial n=1 Tax=Dispira parvispora TaxID=1520584 RepID=A0A9W8AV90_9FUNG|nr:monothiol glutaredoxin grx5 [Dispira parvispora]
MFRSLNLVHNVTRRVALRAPLQARWLTDSAKNTIESSINNSDVCLFMKGTPDEPMCGFSRAAATILRVHGVNFRGVNVLEDQDLRTGIKEYSNWPTIPQVYIKGEFVGGCDILLKMHRDGDLEQLLVEKGVIEPLAEEGTESSNPAPSKE